MFFESAFVGFEVYCIIKAKEKSQTIQRIVNIALSFGIYTNIGVVDLKEPSMTWPTTVSIDQGLKKSGRDWLMLAAEFYPC